MAGSIVSRPGVQEESRSFRRLLSGEAAPLRASWLPSAASPRGLQEVQELVQLRYLGSLDVVQIL